MIGEDYIFIDIPKCATSSVIQQLISRGSYTGPIHNHIPLKSYMEIHGEDFVNDKIVFSVVRHPLDRIYSLWKYYNKLKHSYREIDPDTPTGEHDVHRLVVIEYLEHVTTFDQHVDHLCKWKAPEHFSNIKRSIHEFPYNDIIYKGMWNMLYPDPQIDYVLRFEHLNEDWKKFCEIMKWSYQELEHVNVSNRSKNTEIDMLSNRQINKLKRVLKYEWYIYENLPKKFH